MRTRVLIARCQLPSATLDLPCCASDSGETLWRMWYSSTKHTRTTTRPTFGQAASGIQFPTLQPLIKGNGFLLVPNSIECQIPRSCWFPIFSQLWRCSCGLCVLADQTLLTLYMLSLPFHGPPKVQMLFVSVLSLSVRSDCSRCKPLPLPHINVHVQNQVSGVV